MHVRRGKIGLTIGLMAVVAISTGDARASGDSAPVVEGGTQVRTSEEVAQRFRRLQEQRRPPLRPGYRLAPAEQGPMTAKGELYRYDDGLAMLSVPVTPAQQRVLRRIGAQVVPVVSQVRHHTIFEGRYFRQLDVAPPLGSLCNGCADNRLSGPDPRLLRAKVGQSVELVLHRDRDGRPWVVAVR